MSTHTIPLGPWPVAPTVPGRWLRWGAVLTVVAAMGLVWLTAAVLLLLTPQPSEAGRPVPTPIAQPAPRPAR